MTTLDPRAVKIIEDALVAVRFGQNALSDETHLAKEAAARLAVLSQPQAGEPGAQHVAYFDDGQFHWMSGIAPRNCELYASPQPALAVKGLDDETVKAARIGWEIGRNSWCPAGILADTERTERDWLKALEQIRPALTGSLVASPPPSGEVRWSYDEVERIILDTEPSEMSDRGDRIWTRRMAVALADKLNAVLSSAPATADGWRLVPDGDPVPLDDCPEGLFLFDGHLGFMTEYAVNRQDGFRQRDAFCVDSGEYFWGGTMQARERAKLVVQPMIAAAPTATGGR